MAEGDIDFYVVEDDIDRTISLNTPAVAEGELEIDDTMRETMTKVIDPEVPHYDLSFTERKTALNLGWV
jgi:hypothetical protein